MNIKNTAFFIILSLICQACFAENKLIAFFEPAPESAVKSAHQEFAKIQPQQEEPLPQSFRINPNPLPSPKGIPVLYAGYVNYGEKIQFPLRHKEPKLYLVVTPSIDVVPRQGESVAYLSLNTSTIKKDVIKEDTEDKDSSKEQETDVENKNSNEEQEKNAEDKVTNEELETESTDPQTQQDTTISTTATPGMEAKIPTDPMHAAKVYLLEKKQDEKEVWYWAVSEQEIPENGKISPISLIIICNPNNIFLKTGDSIATEEAHLRLPPIYVLGNNNEENLIKFLDLSRYFEPITTNQKEESETIVSSILSN